MTTAARVNVEIGAAFRGNFKAVFGQANTEMGRIGNTIRTLENRQKELNAVIREQERMGAKGSPLKALYSQQELAGITDKIAKLRAEQERLIGSAARLKQVGDSMRGVGGAFSNVGDKLRTLGIQAAAVGATMGLVMKGALNTASTFERFATVLETTEGSAAAAQKSMDWITEFARTTPYGIEDTTAAFVKLRAYGLDPTNGLLRTLGDTSAAMGKDVMQAVEAIADAVTGENERLKEFGIRGSKSGGMITYEYTTRTGEQASRTVDANNRAMIESTLTAIFNDRYAGAMDKLSNTWGGMISRLGDEWTAFKLGVMRAGLFDWMKGQLGSLLATIDRMSASGELQAWAERTGKALKDFAVGAWELGSAIVSGTRALADFVGGWKPLFGILAGIVLAPFILSVVQLGAALGTATAALMMFATGTATVGAALKTVGAILLANPIGIALTLLSVAGLMLWKNWDGVKGGLVAIWETIRDAGIAAFDALKSAVGSVIDWLAEKTAWIFQTVDKVRAAAGSIGDSIGGAWNRAKGWVGIGPDDSPSAGMAARAPAAAIPAGRAGQVYNDSRTISAPVNVTINGATDAAATQRAVDAALARHRREQEAAQRSMMVDRLGY